MPALGVNRSVLVPLGLNPDHTIQVPPLAAPAKLGLYSHGPQPGDRGPGVILGHINASGVDEALERPAIDVQRSRRVVGRVGQR